MNKRIILTFALVPVIALFGMCGVTSGISASETGSYALNSNEDFMGIEQAYYPPDSLSENYNPNNVDYSLWDKFIKYDLCITDYDSLTDEEKELCKFIFETERSCSSEEVIVCERARRTLAGDKNLGERITTEQLETAYGIWDNYAARKLRGYQSFIHCVPDIRHLDGWGTYNEYWLDDEGTDYVCFQSEGGIEMEYFEVYENGEKYTIEPQPMPSFEHDVRNDGIYFTSDEYIECNGDYYYIRPDNTAVLVRSQYFRKPNITDPIPIDEPHVIPEEVEGCPVVAIDQSAFSGACLTEVVLPETIEFIDYGAFLECKYLEKINFPKSLKYIGGCAFAYSESLKEINIDCPDLTISELAFSDCLNLTDVRVNAEIVGESVFEKCTSLENVTFGENVEEISSKAFNGCSALENIQLPSSLKYIGTGAFLETGIKEINISSDVELIGVLPERTGAGLTSGIYVPATDPLTDMPLCVFNSDCTISGLYDTEAHSYALENNLKFVSLNEDIAFGDINNDGSVGVADVVLLQKCLTGQEKLTGYEGDVNKDGRINAFDVNALKRKLIENY